MRPWTSRLDFLRHALLVEWHAYLSTARWVARRPRVPAGSRPWGYAQASTPVIWLWIFASAVEVPLFHVLVPWEPVRLAGLVLGVWGLVWMVGMLAGLHVAPHLTDDEGLTVRGGVLHEVRLPWSAIAQARLDDRDLASSLWTLQRRELPDGAQGLDVGVGGRTNVELRLREPVTVTTRAGRLTVGAVGLWVDDPRAFVAAAGQRLVERRN